MYTYKGTFVRAVDGDTWVFNLDMGMGHWIHGDDPTGKAHIRAFGINTPETTYRRRGMTDEEWEAEKEAGKEAKTKVQEMLSLNASNIFVSVIKPDKYGGRWCGVVYFSREDFLSEEFALAYVERSTTKQGMDEGMQALRLARQKSFNYWLVENGYAKPYQNDPEYIFRVGR